MGASPDTPLAGHVTVGGMSPRPATLLRLATALTTSLIIVAGALFVVGDGEGTVDANFLGLVGAALIPSIIYAVGVRTPGSVERYGLVLFGVTAFAWMFVFVEDDAMRGVLTFPAFVFTLASSLHGAARDRRLR